MCTPTSSCPCVSEECGSVGGMRRLHVIIPCFADTHCGLCFPSFRMRGGVRMGHSEVVDGLIKDGERGNGRRERGE